MICFDLAILFYAWSGCVWDWRRIVVEVDVYLFHFSNSGNRNSRQWFSNDVLHAVEYASNRNARENRTFASQPVRIYRPDQTRPAWGASYVIGSLDHATPGWWQLGSILEANCRQNWLQFLQCLVVQKKRNKNEKKKETELSPENVETRQTHHLAVYITWT